LATRGPVKAGVVIAVGAAGFSSAGGCSEFSSAQAAPSRQPSSAEAKAVLVTMPFLIFFISNAFRIPTSRWSEDLNLRFSYRAVATTSPLFPGKQAPYHLPDDAADLSINRLVVQRPANSLFSPDRRFGQCPPANFAMLIIF
jgi:hypothetical protein